MGKRLDNMYSGGDDMHGSTVAVVLLSKWGDHPACDGQGYLIDTIELVLIDGTPKKDFLRQVLRARVPLFEYYTHRGVRSVNSRCIREIHSHETAGCTFICTTIIFFSQCFDPVPSQRH